jgi:hypothetical protein
MHPRSSCSTSTFRARSTFSLPRWLAMCHAWWGRHLRLRLGGRTIRCSAFRCTSRWTNGIRRCRVRRECCMCTTPRDLRQCVSPPTCSHTQHTHTHTHTHAHTQPDDLPLVVMLLEDALAFLSRPHCDCLLMLQIQVWTQQSVG